jgi:hypothetical protein
VLAGLAIACVARDVQAQAWTPPAGVGSVSLFVQRIDNTGHRLTDGSLVPDGRSLSLAIYAEGRYALTDRFELSAGVPYVFARYVDPDPPPPFFPFLPVDQCRCWHSSWQDVGVAARYRLINVKDTFVATPSISVGVPSHSYDYRGEAVVGRRLRELRLGIDVGLRLDAISPRLSLGGRYTYAAVERVLGVPNNRSNVGLDAGVQVARSVAVRGSFMWQRTHGGLRVGAPLLGEGLVPPGEVNTPDRLYEHDRLLRDNNLRLEAGVAYQLPSVDVFASYLAYASGTDTHAGRAVTVGVSWPFQVAGWR